MSSRHFVSHSDLAAVSPGGGCLFGYLLPPLSVLGVGALLMFFAFGLSTPPAMADGSPVQNSNLQNNGTLLPLSPIFTPEVQFWAARIQVWAATAGLDPNLAATVMQIESCGDPRALSRSGAMGLFQVMPYHFIASDDPYAPDTNALRGLDYLRRSLEAGHGDPRLALAGYNGGIGVIGLPESNWAEQTQKYAHWGSGIYSDASSGTGEDTHLQEWLTANGVSLCRQAHNRLEISP